MKRVTCYLLVCILLCSMVIPAAAEESTIQPRWSYLDAVSAVLDINWLGVASCSGQAVARKAVDIEVVVNLQQQTNTGWTTLRTWSSTGSVTALASGQYAVYRGYTYRVNTIAYVYDSNGNIIETGMATDTYIF